MILDFHGDKDLNNELRELLRHTASQILFDRELWADFLTDNGFGSFEDGVRLVDLALYANKDMNS